MKRIAIAASLLLACAASASAQTPTASPPQPAPSPSRVYIVNPPQSTFFPTADQETGVWQGCGPAQDQGLLEDFNKEHPRSRIVQVFIDASVPCKAPGAHTFVIVYQEQAQMNRRRVRYPMGR
jgi:hypothetical protein